jgi:tetratricopeptide (TPR) repeat protein
MGNKDYSEEAEAVYRETLAMFPHDIVSRVGLAELLKDKDKLEEAEAILKETVSKFPNAAPAITSLADILMRLGKFDESAELYREARVRFPENVVARNGFAEVLKQMGRIDFADSQPDPSSELQFKYEIAFSFAGENREIVQKLADLLSKRGISVFYDRYEKANLWGKDIYQHLQHIYRDAARFCVVFLSESYAKKLWTRHELKQAQDRAFRENKEYILPIRLDDTKIPGIAETIGYIDIRDTPLADIVNLLLEKIGST